LIICNYSAIGNYEENISLGSMENLFQKYMGWLAAAVVLLLGLGSFSTPFRSFSLAFGVCCMT